MLRYNPFKPGKVVGATQFAGRDAERRLITQSLFQTKRGNAEHFILFGDPGIGKTSLLTYSEGLASGRTDSEEGGIYRFITIFITLNETYSAVGLVKAIGEKLHKAVSTYRRTREVLSDTWEFLKRWQVGGIKYNEGESDDESPEGLLDELVDGIQKSILELREEVDGLLVVLDETERIADTAQIGEFLKGFTERLTHNECNNVALAVSGLPPVIEKLRKSHASSLRAFKIIPLSALSATEASAIIDKGLAQAEERVSIDDEAKVMILDLSQGFPHFVQQFAYAAFESDIDDKIDTRDVMEGAFKKGGALYQLAMQYFPSVNLEHLTASEYLRTLIVMASHGDDWVTDKEIEVEAGLEESAIGSILLKMKKEGIIEGRQGESGIFRLPLKSLAAWIKAYEMGSALGEGQIGSAICA